MPLEDADKEFISTAIAEALKANNTELDKKFTTADQTGKIVKQSLEGLNLAEQITTAVTEATKDFKKTSGDDDPGKKKTEDGKPSATELKLQERLEAMEKKNREAEQARQQAEARERDNRLTGTLRDALGAAGIPADRHGHALPYLRTLSLADGKSVLDFDAEGNPIWRQQGNGYVDVVSIKDGIAAWSKTEAAKVYVPASEKSGTGGSGGSTPTIQDRGNAPRNKDGSVSWGKVRQNFNPGAVTVG